MNTTLQRRLVGLPVDARPVVRAQVRELVASAGWELLLPQTQALGHFRQAADREQLLQWLWDHAAQADGVVLSMDMLLYGGLVPSRFVDDNLESLLGRLRFLAQLKARYPGKPVYAFLATLRISNNNVADEERPYWAQYGQLLWQWSFHSDRAAVLCQADAADPQIEVSLAQAQAAADRVPQHIRDDYRRTRERNFAVAMAVLQAAADGFIDRLVLPQDDTAAYGFNIAERRALQARVLALGLQQRVCIYPGADEVLHTLCAHLVQRLEGVPPLRVALACSDPAHVGALHALYEDRPLLESVAHQVAAVGAQAVAPNGSDAAADLLLALHTQGPEQGDWAMQKPLPQRPGVAPDWWAQLQAAHHRGQPVALVDLAYANGGDPWLLAHLHRLGEHTTPRLPPLFTYAGWNTASNSLGGALAHAVLAHVSVRRGGDWWAAPHQRICTARLFEDGVYQAVLRQALRGCCTEGTVDAAGLQRLAQDLVPPWTNAWAAGFGLGWRVQDVRLPWGRSFEIDLHLQSNT